MIITYDDIYEIFKSNEFSVDSFIGIGREYNLDIYLGFNENYKETILIICNQKPVIKLKASKILPYVGKRKDNRWALCFSLLEDKFLDLFCWFCLDLINNSKNIVDENKAVEFICNRYEKWQKMLTNRSNILLSEQEIKGLIGELFFLKNYLSKKIGYYDALEAWIGPSYATQDFVLKNEWYEIKTTSINSQEISISSVEQLDTINKGKLVVLYLDKTSALDNNKLTINEIVLNIKKEINDDILVSKFEELLLEMGYYPTKEYDNYIYKYIHSDFFVVDQTFPCLRRTIIPKSIHNLKYELLLAEIQEWRDNNDGFGNIS